MTSCLLYMINCDISHFLVSLIVLQSILPLRYGSFHFPIHLIKNLQLQLIFVYHLHRYSSCQFPYRTVSHYCKQFVLTVLLTSRFLPPYPLSFWCDIFYLFSDYWCLCFILTLKLRQQLPNLALLYLATFHFFC